MTTLNTIIEEEKNAFEGAFMNNGVNGVLGDEFQDPKMLLMRTHFTTAMQRAYEAGVAETIKAGLSVIKGEKKDAREIRDLYFPNVKGEPVPNEEWADIINWKNAFNEGNSTAVTALQGLVSK